MADEKKDPLNWAGARDALDNVGYRLRDSSRKAKVSVEEGAPRALRAKRTAKQARQARKAARHTTRKVGFLRYGYYDIAFKFFVEQVLNAEFVQLPEATRRTLELGERYSSDSVCSPFKHILGDYVEALELGADVLVQFTGPCRLSYYGELQESILRDLGYEFDMLNFSLVAGKSVKEYVSFCKKIVNPDISVPQGAANMLVVFRMLELLDAYNDAYLAQAGFAVDHACARKARADFFADMRQATCLAEVNEAYRSGMEALEAVEKDVPADPVRVGIVGEYFTAVDGHSNLGVEDKLIDMGVSLARMLNMTNRNLRYNEPNLRRGIAEYAAFDMGPTSTFSIAAAKRYAEEGFDGIVHLKSSGCTPEIDVMPVLQLISRDFGIPVLYLSYDSQTSDTGLDTRLEAFYDMIAMRKAR